MPGAIDARAASGIGWSRNSRRTGVWCRGRCQPDRRLHPTRIRTRAARPTRSRAAGVRSMRRVHSFSHAFAMADRLFGESSGGAAGDRAGRVNGVRMRDDLRISPFSQRLRGNSGEAAEPDGSANARMTSSAAEGKRMVEARRAVPGSHPTSRRSITPRSRPSAPARRFPRRRWLRRGPAGFTLPPLPAYTPRSATAGTGQAAVWRCWPKVSGHWSPGRGDAGQVRGPGRFIRSSLRVPVSVVGGLLWAAVPGVFDDPTTASGRQSDFYPWIRWRVAVGVARRCRFVGAGKRRKHAEPTLPDPASRQVPGDHSSPMGRAGELVVEPANSTEGV